MTSTSRPAALSGRLALCSLGLLGVALAAAVPPEADQWPRFRGHNGTGIAQAPAIPVQWTEADYNWKTKLPGTGHSSPAVWGDRLFVTCADRETTTAPWSWWNWPSNWIQTTPVLWQYEA